MWWKDIEFELGWDIMQAHEELKELAPQNSKYVSYHRGQLADYIFVDNIKTYTNTNHLFNSISYKETQLSGKSFIATTYVDGNTVPYYQEAVLSPILKYARQHGKTEYGSFRHSPQYVDEREKENRNYMYYMRGSYIFRTRLGGWNNRIYRVKDSIGDFL